MMPLKITKDYLKKSILKKLYGDRYVPRELFELHNYFRHYQSITFTQENKGNSIIAISTNFRYGSIVTSGKNQKELDQNIQDAILTSFDLPSAYVSEATIVKEGANASHSYALA